MAINVYTPFRADEYAYQGGAALAQGISQGAQNFTAPLLKQKQSIFEQMLKDKKQEKQEGKLATSLRATLKNLDAADALQNGREPQPHKYDLMGPQELKGTMDAMGWLSHQKEVDQRNAHMGAVISKLQADEQNNARAPGFFA